MGKKQAGDWDWPSQSHRGCSFPRKGNTFSQSVTRTKTTNNKLPFLRSEKTSFGQPSLRWKLGRERKSTTKMTKPAKADWGTRENYGQVLNVVRKRRCAGATPERLWASELTK